MSKLILQVRTKDNLLELLAASESRAWVVAADKINQITHVQIVNFDGTQMIEGIFDRNDSYRSSENKLVIKFLDGRIVNCRVQFDAQNPVRYFT
ncbi:hypothetical protein [Egbenema bharatensis]|uniref:hypothetical protein n=1 Tax=Egbenema bharatensis TaxID=3463334 RepID=UPI003A8A358A